MFKTTEITAYTISSDNVIHQRLFFAYEQTVNYVSGRMLEIGCGVGKGLELFPKACEHYSAVDKNTALINHLKEHFPDYRFLNKNIPPLTDFEDNSFDTVVTQQVIEHIENDDLFVKEIHRVLKPGGVAVITTPNIRMSLTRNPWHVREYTDTELLKLLGKYFKDPELKGITGNDKVMAYYEENKKSVARITRWDILNLQHNLPRRLLQVPYDILNRMNRKSLEKQDSGSVSDVTTADYFFTDNTKEALDFFAVVRK